MDGAHPDISFLRSIPLFAPLSGAALAELREVVSSVEIDGGEVVISEGAPSHTLYCLVSGEAQVVKNYLEDGAHTVDVLQAPAFFGEMGLVLDDMPRSATVVATEPCRFLTLGKEEFRRFLLSNVETTYVLLVEAYRRLRQANELIADAG